MNVTLGTVAAAALAVFAASAGSTGAGRAASRTACEVLSAAQASAILSSPVTARGHSSPISSSSTVCVYQAAGRAIAQLGITVMESEAVAVQNFKTQEQVSAQHKNVGDRQKGNVVISGITMNGDTKQLNELLDAAARNL